MCDFSLMHVKSRAAAVGDKLETRNFGTGTRGFAAPSDPTTAVCIRPGTELAFDAEVRTHCYPQSAPLQDPHLPAVHSRQAADAPCRPRVCGRPHRLVDASH